MLGFHEDQIRTLPVDRDFRLTAGNLGDAVDADTAAGRIPFLVVANGGATSTGTVDPLGDLSAVCRERGVWLHVDAAYGGFAVLTERGRSLLKGLGDADSVTLDPHKWLYQPFEAGCLLVRDSRLLADAFRVRPDYLQDAAVTAEAPEINFADRGFQLTRSPRALKVWASLKYFGVDRFAEAIDRCLDLAGHAASLIDAEPSLERLAGPNLGVVCFRWRGDDAADEAGLERINTHMVRAFAESGAGMLSSTRLHGRYAIRMCILNHGTRLADVERVLAWFAANGADAAAAAAQPDFSL
jgi:glutamate/tyrosine decarboxylase-like PLP-dependent enzyme